MLSLVVISHSRLHPAFCAMSMTASIRAVPITEDGWVLLMVTSSQLSSRILYVTRPTFSPSYKATKPGKFWGKWTTPREIALLLPQCSKMNCATHSRSPALIGRIVMFDILRPHLVSCFLPCSGLRNQSETYVGCIVSSTTSTRCSQLVQVNFIAQCIAKCCQDLWCIILAAIE